MTSRCRAVLVVLVVVFVGDICFRRFDVPACCVRVCLCVFVHFVRVCAHGVCHTIHRSGTSLLEMPSYVCSEAPMLK